MQSFSVYTIVMLQLRTQEKVWKRFITRSHAIEMALVIFSARKILYAKLQC